MVESLSAQIWAVAQRHTLMIRQLATEAGFCKYLPIYMNGIIDIENLQNKANRPNQCEHSKAGLFVEYNSLIMSLKVILN